VFVYKEIVKIQLKPRQLAKTTAHYYCLLGSKFLALNYGRVFIIYGRGL